MCASRAARRCRYACSESTCAEGLVVVSAPIPSIVHAPATPRSGISRNRSSIPSRTAPMGMARTRVHASKVGASDHAPRSLLCRMSRPIMKNKAMVDTTFTRYPRSPKSSSLPPRCAIAATAPAEAATHPSARRSHRGRRISSIRACTNVSADRPKKIGASSNA